MRDRHIFGQRHKLCVCRTGINGLFKYGEYAGGMINGGHGFKKERDGVACCIEMDAAGGIEAGVWDGKAVPAASCSGSVVCVIGVRRFVRQAVREAAGEKNQYKESIGITKEGQRG